MGRILKDIPSLVQTLKGQRAQVRDLIIPSALLSMRLMDMSATDEEDETESAPQPVLSVTERQGERSYRLQEHVHGQLAGKLGIPGRYYSRMRKEAGALLLENVNHWLSNHDRNRLVRFMGEEVRAVLSDRYRPISHFDLVLTAVQVITGQDGQVGAERPWARGAKCFAWRLNPTQLDVCLVNPSILFDLKAPENGVLTPEVDSALSGAGGGTDMVYPGLHVQSHNPHQAGWFLRPEWGDSHYVFPACRIRNSETGHGGLYIQPGLYEAVCDNTAWIGKNLAERHLGKTLEEDEDLSPQTYHKMNAVIFSKTGDVVRAVFEPDRFAEQCRKFLRLKTEEIQVKEAAEQIAHLPGLTEEIAGDILKVYKAVNGRDTAFSLQRAVTEAGRDLHGTEQSERAYLLEELGGEMIERGMRAILSPKVHSLQAAA